MKKIAVILGIILLLTGCDVANQDEPMQVPESLVVTDAAEQTDTAETEATHEETVIPTEAVDVDETSVPTEETTISTEETTAPATSGQQYLGICDLCGEPYGYGEGFESLCTACQKKYGPKCSVCGTDCTYRGTIDGMCDECWSASQSTCFWCGIVCGTDGQWADEYYTCSSCGALRPCQNCGAYYYFWKMFEGVCYDCDDPSDGAAEGSE